MDKILVEIYLPAVNRTYDVFIPMSSKIYEVEALLSGAFADLSNGYFSASRDTILCLRETGNLLDINKSALELGLSNGTRLMLI